MNDDKRSILRRTRFGFVFQFGQLVPELTSLDNVALPLLLNGAKRQEAYKQAGALAQSGRTQRQGWQHAW